MNGNPSTVELRGITKSYGSVVAVKPLEFTVEGGTLVTLLGPSGCGKTTLLRMIAGLERVSGGSILIGGRDVTTMSAGERNVSMVFQSYALFPHMSVRDNVAYGLISGGMAKAQALEQVETALAGVDLANMGHRLPSEMSGGQQQRVAVARALVLNPEVLLFDEPLSNLDAKLRRSMREEIRALQQRLGITVIYVTHDQSEAMAVSDTIVVMRNAEIAQAGTPQRLYEQPDNLFVATFMGDANIVRGALSDRKGDTARVKVGSTDINLPHRNLPDGSVNVVVRPQSIVLTPAGAPGSVPATIRTATYMGSHYEYNLETPLGPLFVVSEDKEPAMSANRDAGFRFGKSGIFVVAG